MTPANDRQLLMILSGGISTRTRQVQPTAIGPLQLANAAQGRSRSVSPFAKLLLLLLLLSLFLVRPLHPLLASLIHVDCCRRRRMLGGLHRYLWS